MKTCASSFDIQSTELEHDASQTLLSPLFLVTFLPRGRWSAGESWHQSYL